MSLLFNIIRVLINLIHKMNKINFTYNLNKELYSLGENANSQIIATRLDDPLGALNTT